MSFFFQAEDGIRDADVTGVQTCALPIYELAIHPIVFYGVLKHLIENNWVDREFIAARTTGWEQVEAKARSLPWEVLERGAGQSKADMFRFAQAFGTARSAVIIWSMGVTQHRYGSDNVRAIVNLH